MASLFLFTFSPTFHLDFPISSDFFCAPSLVCSFHGGGIGGRRRSVRGFVVRSTHSNARILKPKRRSRFGETLSLFDSDGDEENVDGFSSDEDEEDDGDISDVECDAKRKRTKLQSRAKNNHSQRDNLRHAREIRGVRSSNVEKFFKVNANLHDFQDNTNDTEKQDFTFEEEVRSTNIGGKGKLMTKKSMAARFPRLAEEMELDEKWIPLLDYLTTFGLKDSHFLQIVLLETFRPRKFEI